MWPRASPDLNFLLYSPRVFHQPILSLVAVCICTCPKAVCKDATVSVFVSVWVWMSAMSEWLVPNRGLGSPFYWTAKKTSNGTGMRDTLQQFYSFIRDNVADSDPDNKQYYRHQCLSSNIPVLHSIFMLDIYFIRLFTAHVFCFKEMIVMTQIQTTYAMLLGQGHGKVYNAGSAMY